MNNIILFILILTLSFGCNSQSLAQNIKTKPNSNIEKIKISADNPPIPSYLKHSKKAQAFAQKKEKQKKDNSFGNTIFKMVKALVLAIALFFGLAAILAKYKDKFNLKSNDAPISLSQAVKGDDEVPHSDETPTQEEHKSIQSEPIRAEKQLRYLVFKFFNMNK